MSLKNTVCIITGSGSGIGKASALKMAKEGAQIVLVGRTASKLKSVESEINSSGGISKSFALDVADSTAVHAMATEVIKEFGSIDILVNNAGHNSPHRMLLTTTPDDIKEVLASNLVGTIYCTQAVVPSMMEAGKGTIINISSISGIMPVPMGGMIYSASKAAVINLTEFINEEFKNTGIRASVIIPGEVDTPLLDTRPVVPSKKAKKTMVTSDDVAEAIMLIANLPNRSAIPHLVIQPTILRDQSGEVGIS